MEKCAAPGIWGQRIDKRIEGRNVLKENGFHLMIVLKKARSYRGRVYLKGYALQEKSSALGEKKYSDIHYM